MKIKFDMTLYEKGTAAYVLALSLKEADHEWPDPPTPISEELRLELVAMHARETVEALRAAGWPGRNLHESTI